MRKRLSMQSACPSLLALLLTAGCGGGKYYDEGRKAEERGEPHVAYDQYCRAAADARGGAPASGLARVRASASAYWESQALLELDSGNYAEAWRMLMKALEIQPDSATTAQLIRQVELQHTDAIASARMDWMRRGTPALASALRTKRGKSAPDETNELRPPEKTPEPDQVAVANPAPVAPPAAPDAAAKPVESSAAAEPSKKPAEPVVIQAPTAQADPVHSENQAPQTAAPTAPVEAKTEKPIIRPMLESPREEQPAPKRTRPPVRAQPPIAVQSEPPGASDTAPVAAPPIRMGDSPKQELGKARKPSRPAVSAARGEFLVVQTLSLKDKLYARSLLGVEGIEILLKDTDSDEEADFDLFAGKTKVKKIRDLKLGRSQVFAGQSGNLYRITLLGIQHKTHTVRIGIRPA